MCRENGLTLEEKANNEGLSVGRHRGASNVLCAENNCMLKELKRGQIGLFASETVCVMLVFSVDAIFPNLYYVFSVIKSISETTKYDN